MYYLIVFSDYEQREIIFIGRYKKMKSIIEYTDGIVNYSNLENKSKNIYKTHKQLFKVIKKTT